MKKSLTCSLTALLVLAAAAAVSQSAEWKQYVYPNDGFAISAPAKPQAQDQSTDTATGRLQSHTYAIELGGDSGFMVSVTDFGKGPNINAKAMLQAARDGSLKSTNSKLISEKEISLEGNPGLEFDFEAPAHHGRARYYIFQGRLLTLMSIAPAGKPLSLDTARIFNSLRFLKIQG